MERREQFAVLFCEFIPGHKVHGDTMLAGKELARPGEQNQDSYTQQRLDKRD